MKKINSPDSLIILSLHPDKKIPDCGTNFGNFLAGIPHQAAFLNKKAHAQRQFH